MVHSFKLNVIDFMKAKFWVLCIVSMSVGLLTAWMDSRPNWDDTGITVAFILGTTMILGFSMPRFAWLWAILDGIWIPINNLIFHQQYTTLIVLMIAFMGSYSGVFIRKMFKFVSATAAPHSDRKSEDI
jgi:nicotinamide riboside transporter PnuC